MIARLSNRRKATAGFTLIELLVVVLILGILLAVALPLYLSSVRNAADGTVKANIRSIVNAEQAYQVKNQAFTSTWANLTGDLGPIPTGATSPFDGNPKNVNYTITSTAPLTVVATETGDVFGTSAPNETITYTQAVGASTGTFTP